MQLSSYQSPSPLAGGDNTAIMRVRDWVLTLIVLAIPLVNIVMLFVWGFGSGNPNRANFCKAYLLLILVILVIYGVIFALVGTAGMMSLAPQNG
ncbi:hypothetical protein [Snodgrassella sp. CFCC 13594]|uniref:hypothetical protein n=1 Tax=Snodgrassella sp. CFCC 13594 TaxID=1775559 RepID=UPI000831E4FA|nr:hypothetical protein [Snodgrassella sp. CFCC 13594]